MVWDLIRLVIGLVSGLVLLSVPVTFSNCLVCMYVYMQIYDFFPIKPYSTLKHPEQPLVRGSRDSQWGSPFAPAASAEKSAQEAGRKHAKGLGLRV